MSCKTEQDLMDGKIGAVKRALKEAKVFLQPEALDKIEQCIDIGRRYQIEIICNEDHARNRLALERVDAICSVDDSYENKIETGEVVFGTAELGLHYVRYIDSKLDATRHVQPQFNPDYPLVVFVTQETRKEGKTTTRAKIFKIIIYAPFWSKLQ